MRSSEHAILIGTNTPLLDNPRLTTREIVGRNPLRILIDFDLKVSQNFNIYNEEAPTLVFNLKKEAEKGNIKFIKIEKENFLENLMQKLFDEQIQSIIVEGGSFTLQQFINENLWDEAILIKNENLNLIHGTKAPKFNFEPSKTENFRDNKVEFYIN
jgi:diaminohydroxyphosphoribosylaminopyrimidine deaminase/5-amino-6-(5-phosphoribosylamino)uracil reductase